MHIHCSCMTRPFRARYFHCSFSCAGAGFLSEGFLPHTALLTNRIIASPDPALNHTDRENTERDSSEVPPSLSETRAFSSGSAGQVACTAAGARSALGLSPPPPGHRRASGRGPGTAASRWHCGGGVVQPGSGAAGVGSTGTGSRGSRAARRRSRWPGVGAQHGWDRGVLRSCVKETRRKPRRMPHRTIHG